MLSAVAMWIGYAPVADAHMSTVGYSEVTLDDNSVHYSLYLDPQEVGQWMDLHSGQKVFVLDPDGASKPDSKPDGIGWDRSRLQNMASRYLTVSGEGKPGRLELEDATLAKRGNNEYIRFDIAAQFDVPIRSYEIRYNFFFDDLDPLHQNFASVHAGEQTIEKVIDRDNRVIKGSAADVSMSSGKSTIEIAVPGWLNTFWTYTYMGMLHIWEGYDHLLFLLGLILLRQKKTDYVKMLTAFTIGHSITLAVSALDWFTISLRIIEPLIALSIVYVAVENIWFKRPAWRWGTALLFGLVHGFGFADILRGALPERFVLSLFSFNLGVEIGQLAVLAVLLPLLWLLGKLRWYPSFTTGMSGMIGCLGLLWFVQRIIGE